MYDQRFDDLVKRAASTSRRQILGSLLGGLTAAVGVHHVAATRRGNSDCVKRCKELFPPGKERGRCISAGAKGRGPCISDGGEGTCADPRSFCVPFSELSVCGEFADGVICVCLPTSDGGSFCTEGVGCGPQGGCQTDADCEFPEFPHTLGAVCLPPEALEGCEFSCETGPGRMCGFPCTAPGAVRAAAVPEGWTIFHPGDR